MNQKPTRWRSKKYRDWIKTLPCCTCGAPAEPHHLKGVGNMSGGGLKAPDWACMPLCHHHHMEMHNTPELWPQQVDMVVGTIDRAIDAEQLDPGDAVWFIDMLQ